MQRISELHVNGNKLRIDADTDRSLLSVLRDDLDLTGSKYGCGEGQCGACTVLIDGQATRSCITKLAAAAGKKITTIEGIGTPDRMNEVQKAFVKHDAQQCGFCTPGFVTAATAFVRANPRATAEQVRAGLGGNLCRCGTYAGMILAVVDAAKGGSNA